MTPKELERLANWQLLENWYFHMHGLPPGVLSGHALDVHDDVGKAIRARREDVEKGRKESSVSSVRLAGLAARVLKIIHHSDDAKLTHPDKPAAKANKRGRKSSHEESKRIVDEFDHGVKNDLWVTAVEYLQAEHAARWKKNPGNAESWFSSLRKRVRDVTRKLLVCEGPWDAITADHHLRDRKVRQRYDVLAVPGAGVFKESWCEHFRNRSIRFVYDNDEAGRKGQERAAKILKPFAADISVLKWPEELKLTQGYDVSDLIRDGECLADFTNKHCVKVGAGTNRIVFVRGDAIAEEKVEWLWDGHIQFGTFVSCSGLMGTHKSGLIRDLVARGTAGLPMPNCSRGLSPFDVMYLTSEDGASQVRDLVRLAGGNLKPTTIEYLARLTGISSQVCRDHYLQWTSSYEEVLWDCA